MPGIREFKINNFDLLRLIAATEVIADHFFQHLNVPISKTGLEVLYLFPGVPVFFVISGYLISASFERNSKLTDYLKNRALRIFPGLWGCILISIVIISFTGISFINKETMIWLPCQFFGIIYTPGFLANYGFGSYNGSLWTIPVELQFYLVLPLIYRLVPQKKLTTSLIVLFFLFLMVHIYWLLMPMPALEKKIFGYLFLPYFYLFLLGVIFQRLRIYDSRFIYNKALYWTIGYLAYSLIFPDYIPQVVFTLIKNLTLAFVVISLAYTRPGVANKILHGTDISYGIYIYHGLLLTVIVQEKIQDHVGLISIIVVTYVMAYISWIAIEKPFLRSKKKALKTYS
jgi:peptidoglycan/LPS O-acetylase OafA/YrhL